MEDTHGLLMTPDQGHMMNPGTLGAKPSEPQMAH